MSKKLNFLVMMLLGILLSINQAWGATETVTLDIAGTSKWTNNVVTKSGVTMTITKGSLTNNASQTRLSSGAAFTITAPSGKKVVSAQITTNSTSTYVDPLKSTSSTYTGSTCTVSGTTATITVSSGYSSIVCTNLGGAIRVTSCKVTIDDASCTAPGTALSVTSAATATVGTPLSLTTTGGNGGTVTWSVTNGTGSATVSGSMLTPVTAGTITVKAHQDQSGTTCEQDAEQTVTISKQVASFTFSDDYVETTTYYVGDQYTLPSTTSAECGDKTFVGWSTTPITETSPTKPTSNYYDKGSKVTLVSDNSFYAVFATESAGASISYSFTINYSDLTTTSYANNNKSHDVTATCTTDGSKKLTIAYTTNQVMQSSSKLQFQKDNGCLYNTTDLGSITSVTLASGATALTTFYGTSSHPTSGPSVGSGNGYFTVVQTGATGSVSSITVNFTKGGSTYTDYLTECCTPLAAPTHLQSSPTGTGGTISWDDVDGANGYEVKIDGGEWTSAGIVGTSYTITGKECGGTSVTWQVRATGTGSYCAEGAACAEQNFVTASCACGEYSFHYKDNSSNWNTGSNICFHQVNGDLYLTDEFAIPVGVSFKVGWQGGDHWDRAKTSETDFQYMMGGDERKWSFGNHPYVGYIAGALGYMRVYGNSGDNNKYVGFIPSGYTVNLGTGDNNSNWNNERTIVLSGKTTDYDENEWYSELTTLTADEIGKKLYVGLKTSAGGVWFTKSVAENLTGLRMKNGASTWVEGGMAAAHSGQKGKFRIYANSTDNNLYVTFVPYWQASFDVQGGSAVAAVLPENPVSCEETAANRTIVLPTSTKTGHSLKWSDGVNEYNAGAEVVLTADKAFTAQWTAATYTITYKDKDNAAFSGTSWTSSQPTTHTYGSATELVEPRKDNYRFDGWFTTSACTGEPITSLGATAFTVNITLYAKWTRVYTVQFEENGVVDGAKTILLAVGESTELPSTTISDCNEYDTFEGWVAATVDETTTKPGSVLAGGATYTLANDGDVTLKALYSKCEGSGPEVYEKVTSNANVTDGEYVLIDSIKSTGSYIFTGWNTSSYGNIAAINLRGNDATVLPGNLPGTTKVVTISVGTGDDAGKFAIWAGKRTDSGHETEDNYLTYSGSSNTINTSTSKVYTWKLTDGSKVNSKDCPAGAINSTTQDTRVMQYVSTAGGRFACYANSQTNYVFLYKKTGGCVKSYATNPDCVTPDNYTITYDANQYYGGVAAEQVEETTVWNTNTTIKTIGATGFTASNARGEFVGWNTNADGSGTAYEVGATVKNKNLTLFAQWENHYYVNFYDGSHMTPAEIAPIRQTTAGQTIDISTISGTLTCDSYNFVGWATNSTVYNDNMPQRPTIVTEVAPTDADINVYALYTQDAVSPEFTANCNGGNYYISATVNSSTYTMCDVLNGSGFAYNYEYYHDQQGEDCDKVFTLTKIANNTYTIQRKDGKYLCYTKDAYNSKLSYEATDADDKKKWIIEEGTVVGRGAWCVKNKNQYSSNDYSLQYNPNYFKGLIASSVSPTGNYNLDFTPAGGASSYNSNPNCDPYQITFVTNGGTMTAPAGLTLNQNGNQYETGDIDAGLVTDFTLTAAAYPGWTFEGWKMHEAQDDVTSAPGLLLPEGEAQHVVNNITYYAVYSKLDDEKTFDPDVEDTYNIYGVNGATKVFFPAIDLKTRDGAMGTVTGVNTCSGAADVRIVPGSGEHAGQYQIFVSDGTNDQCLFGKAGETALGEKPDTWWYIRNSTSGKGTYRIISVAEDAKEYLSQRALGFYTSTGSFQHMDVSSNLNNAGQTMYRDVEIGVCQETHYTSTPVLTPTITLRGAPMVTSYKDKGIQATEKILVTASNFSANQKLYVTFDNADVKVLTGGTTGVSLNAGNYSFQVDGTGALVNKELTIVYTPSAFGDGSINTVTITVADNANPAATENKATRNTIQVRNLWEKFVVAQQVGDEWYALPSEMSNNYTSSTAALKMKYNSTEGRYEVPAITENQYAYSLLAGKKTPSAMVFSSPMMGGNIIKVNGTKGNGAIGLYASGGLTPSAGDNYEFVPTTTDLEDYKLQNPFQEAYLGITAGNWGVGAETNVRFLPYYRANPTSAVTFNPNSGNALEDACAYKEIEYGTSPAACYSELSRTGYTFAGFYDAQEGGHLVFAAADGTMQANSAYTDESGKWASVAEEATVWAHWTPIVYNITYNLDGGTNGTNLATYTIESANITLQDATKDGYSFDGWYTESTFNNKVTGVAIPTGSRGDKEFWAKWTRITLTGEVKVTSTAGKLITSVQYFTLNAEGLNGTETVTLTSDNPNMTFAPTDIPAIDGVISDVHVQVKYQPSVTTDGTETATIYAYRTAQPTQRSANVTATGRHLPTKFLIAQKVGDEWYALPNTMSNSQGNPTAVRIDVNEATGVATVRNSTADMFAYKLLAGKNDGTKMVFSSPLASTGAGNVLKVHTTVSSTSVGLYAQSGWTSAAAGSQYEFQPTSSDLVDYKLLNVYSESKCLSVNAGKWGVYTGEPTVRFFAIDQVAPASITWRNEQAEDEKVFFVNTAENGVITLPASDPTPCSNTLFTFVGWTSQEPGVSGYWGAQPTLVTAGQVQTTDIIYRAVYRHNKNNRYYLACPAIYYITYKANGGTGADVVEESTTLATTTNDGSTFSKDGYILAGWCEQTDGQGARIYKPDAAFNHSSGTYDVTLYAVWMGELTITGDVHLTSGMNAAGTAGIPVYTTSAAGNLITVACEHTAPIRSITITYLDADDNVIDKTNSKFRLCNDGTTNYNLADASGIAFSGALNQTYAISYTPTAANSMDVGKIRLQAKNSSGQVLREAMISLYGRSLPDQFAIVMQNPANGQWYALPNDLDISTDGVSSTKAPIAVTVDNAADPTKVTYASPKVLYQTDARYASASDCKTSVRLLRSGAGTNAWITASSTSLLYMPANGAQRQQFYLKSSDLNNYNVLLDPSISKSKYLSMFGGTIGWYSTEYKNVRFLPVEAMPEGDELDIVDWKKDGSNYAIVLNMTNWSAKQDLKGSVNSAAETTLTRNADRTVDVAVGTLTPDSYVTVTLRLADNSKTSTAKYRVPFIYDGGTMEQGSMTSDSYVIVNSGTVTVSGTVSVKDVQVKPGAKLHVTGVNKLKADRLVLRSEPWIFPNLKADRGAVTVQTYYYTRRVADKSRYYQFASPYEVVAKDIVLSTGVKPAYASTWVLKSYSGASRATNGMTNDANWEEKDAATNVAAMTGYEMWSNSNLYREYMFPYATARLNDANPATISLTAHPAAAPIDGGWNFVVSPLTYDYTVNSVSGFTIDPIAPSEQPKLAEMYEDGRNYYQFPVQGATIRAFSPFYYQAASNGTMTFGADGALSCTANYLPGASFAPARQAEEQLREQWIQLFVEDANGTSDQTNIYIKPQFSVAYETGLDVVKMSTTGERPFVYVQLPCGNLAFAAIPDSLAETRIPLAVSAPAEGEMTFSLRENRWLERLDHVFLVDETLGFATDLLEDAYTYDAQAGTTVGRFYLQAVFKAPGIATDMETIDSGGGTIVVSRDGSRIVVSGLTSGTEVRLYDAVGHLLSQTKAAGESVDMSVPVTGVYFLQVGEQVNKLILNK